MNMVGSRQNIPSWISAAATMVDFEGNPSSADQQYHHPKPISDSNLNFAERTFSAAGAAFFSAIVLNPLDIAKTRLQAQAAGVLYQGLCHNACFVTNTHMKSSMHCVVGPEPACQLGCNKYKGTLDVLYKVIRQEGFLRLWRGTNASLALAVPTVGIYLPCYDIFRNWMQDIAANNAPAFTPYVPLVAGSLARSLACITCYPVELARTRMQMRRTILGMAGNDASVASVLGANFSAAFISGSLAAAVTCPLDVARTRRQIEKDSARAMSMTTRKTLTEIWRGGGIRGLFTGIGPRLARAGPSAGIVVSSYEVVKYTLLS